MAHSQFVKNAARTRHSAKKAGIKIAPTNPEGPHQDKLEQEQPDIM